MARFGLDHFHPFWMSDLTGGIRILNSGSEREAVNEVSGPYLRCWKYAVNGF
jgi:hypothetical protein